MSDIKCACEKCVCTVSEERAYCSDSCKDGSCSEKGCGHKGCDC